jgi:hypothetical protein
MLPPCLIDSTLMLSPRLQHAHYALIDMVREVEQDRPALTWIGHASGAYLARSFLQQHVAAVHMVSHGIDRSLGVQKVESAFHEPVTAECCLADLCQLSFHSAF